MRTRAVINVDGEIVRKIKAKGDAYSSGVIYGNEAKDKILENVEAYKSLYRELGLSWDRVKAKVEEGKEEIRSFDGDAFDFINGISEGSGASLEDILVINYRYEFLSSQETSSCTSIGVLGTIQEHKKTIIAQTWDFREDFNRLVNLELSIGKNPKVFTQVEAGLIAHRGMNSEGIGLCINALSSKEDTLNLGIPLVSVLPWAILNLSSITKALDLIVQARRGSSINYLLCKDGFVIDAELTPNYLDFIEPDEHGIIIHTNHFLHDRLKEKEKRISSSSLTRFLRTKTLVKEMKAKIGVEEIKTILRDHFDYPSSICRHPGTNASAIINVTDREFLYTIGNPCSSDYTNF